MRRSVSALGLVCALCAAAGCSNLVSYKPAPRPDAPAADVPGPEPEPAPDEPAVRPRLSDTEAAEVEGLLARADRAIEDDHLTYPSRGSALALYDQVKILDPDNETARRGLERIVERYLELALQAAEQGRFSQAKAMLDRSRLVDPGHPGIAPVEARVHLLSTAERRVIPLDGRQLSDRAPAVEEALRQAGMASQADGCRAQITARSDSEGRWIYQRMSEAGSRSRIQAELDIGTPPRIEVLCFPQ